MTIRTACVQLAPRKAEVAHNLDRIAEAILQAAHERAELVVFSETATTGYFLEGGVLEASLTVEALRDGLLARLSGLNRPVDAVIGFIQNAGGTLHNSAAYLEFDGKGARIVHVYRKFFLPTYGVFDEERFVARGRQLGVFDSRLGRMAILICEDVWHSVMPTLCAVHGAQMIIVPAASPARGFGGDMIENLDRYGRLMRAMCEEHGVFGVNCQLIGFEGGKGFVGGSMMVDPLGRTVAQSPGADEHLLVADLDLDLIAIARSQSPLLSDLQSAWADVSRIAAKVEPT